MLSRIKLFWFSAFRKARELLWATGIDKIPGVRAAHKSLFHLLWSQQSVVEIQGSKMYLDPRGLAESYEKAFQAYIMDRGHEKLTTEMFKKVVKQGDVVLDLGANIGYYALLAARLVGEKGIVYAFEPEPTNYSLLLKNIELNEYHNIVPVQKAVSNITGMVRLFLDEKDAGAHTIYQPEANRESVEIQSVALDKFFEDKKHPIDVIKMDIEGAEMSALSGMKRIIRENENLKMFVEFYLPGIERTDDSPQEFIRSLLVYYDFPMLAISEYSRTTHEIHNIDDLVTAAKRARGIVNVFLSKRRLPVKRPVK